MKIGKRSPGIAIRTDQSAEENELADQYMRLKRKQDPAFVAWQHEVTSRALPASKAAELRKRFRQHISTTRNNEDQELLQKIKVALKKKS